MGSEHGDFDLKDGGVLKQLSAQRPISCIFQTYRISRLGFILPLFLVLLCAHSRTCLGACPDHAVGRPACRAWSTSRVLNVRRQAAPPLPLPPSRRGLHHLRFHVLRNHHEVQRPYARCSSEIQTRELCRAIQAFFSPTEELCALLDQPLEAADPWEAIRECIS